MDRQGYDPLDHDVASAVDFLEQIETAEDFKGTSKPSNDHKSSGKQKPSKKGNDTRQSGKYCLIHGRGSHSSDECKKLQADAKRHKSSNDFSDGKSNGKFGNKSWSRKGSDENNKSKKELAAFVKKAIKSGVQKEIAAYDKKRKIKEPGELDLNAFEDLKDFNYADMDNLKIDSDDDISV